MDKTIYADYENGFSFKTFKSAIRTQKTFRTYRHCLYDFVKFTGLKSYDDILKLEQKELQDKLMKYIMHDTEKGLRGTSIRAKLCAIELFLDINDKPYNKKLIHRLIPINDDVSSGDVPFTNEDISRMLECTTSLRTKAIVHFLASTGVRPASIVDPVLRRKHLVDMPDNCKAIKIYDKSKSGYWAFLTPEASKALHDYFQSRKLNGEILSDESPIFSNRADAHNVKQEYLSVDSLTRIIYNLLRKASIERTKSGNRYDKAMVYGFRKLFNTVLKLNNNVNSNVAEKLMAHKRGLDGSYLKPTREECFSEFVKAVFDLTISDETKGHNRKA